ncbi:Ribosomal RNA small subunit methyltransferase D [Rickettsiales bacterium Ac37b]|nr:Ribosomal RNA small subunit methyltransferase D [Rickettsiales bacterium Ac37b]
MRIIAGKHKGRNIMLPTRTNVRPTTSKTREGIFNILNSGQFLKEGISILHRAKILELFCGSGALSFESLSRGAEHAIMVDNNQENLNYVALNAEKLSESNNISIIRTDASFLPKANHAVDIVFIDPPYNSNVIESVLYKLQQQNWLKNDTIIVIDAFSKEDINIPLGYNHISQRIYGKTKIIFLGIT